MTHSTFTEGATILTGFHTPLCPSQVTDGSRPLVVKIKQSLGFFPVSPSNTWKLQSIVFNLTNAVCDRKLYFVFISFNILTK